MIFDSGVSLSDLKSDVAADVDIIGSFSDSSFLRWVNTLEQLMYENIITEYRKIDATPILVGSLNCIKLEDLYGQNEEPIRFDDVCKVFADGIELEKIGLLSSDSFYDKPCFYGYSVSYTSGGVTTVKDSIVIPSDTLISSAKVLVRERPKRKTMNGSALPSVNVSLPFEWMEMVMCYIKGQAYKYAGDDTNAAKWLGEYNNYMESFKEWYHNRTEAWGQ